MPDLEVVTEEIRAAGDSAHQAAELYESNEEAAADAIGMPHTPEPGV